MEAKIIISGLMLCAVAVEGETDMFMNSTMKLSMLTIQNNTIM